MKRYMLYMLILSIGTVFIGVLSDIYVAFALFIVATAYGLKLENLEESKWIKNLKQLKLMIWK